jgi:hypothetical protein
VPPDAYLLYFHRCRAPFPFRLLRPWPRLREVLYFARNSFSWWGALTMHTTSYCISIGVNWERLTPTSRQGSASDFGFSLACASARKHTVCSCAIRAVCCILSSFCMLLLLLLHTSILRSSHELTLTYGDAGLSPLKNTSAVFCDLSTQDCRRGQRTPELQSNMCSWMCLSTMHLLRTHACLCTQVCA